MGGKWTSEWEGFAAGEGADDMFFSNPASCLSPEDFDDFDDPYDEYDDPN